MYFKWSNTGLDSLDDQAQIFFISFIHWSCFALNTTKIFFAFFSEKKCNKEASRIQISIYSSKGSLMIGLNPDSDR